MKKSVSFLLCFMIIFSLVSCLFEPDSLDNTAMNTLTPDDTEDNDRSTMEIQKTPTDEPTEMIESTKYYKIEKLLLTTVRYSIYDSNGTVVLCEETDRPLQISMLDEDVVDICIGMGTGISVHKYYDTQNNRFSDEYSDVIATSGNLVAYIDVTSTKDPINHRMLVVRDIFDSAVFYKSFCLHIFSTAHNPILSASFSQGEMDLKILYRTTYYYPISIVLPIRQNASGGIYASVAERAMDAFSEVLKNDIAVHEMNGTTIESECALKDIKTPYDRTPLGEIKELKYTYLDLDGDYVKELIIDCGDIFVLRYYEHLVYVYPFTFRNMYSLKTDGSYSWNYTGQNFEYGENKIAFDGVELKIQGIWRIVNDGTPNAEYYIGDKKVTREEISNYFENNPKTEVEFAPLETTWKDVISTDEALEIAKTYWENSCNDEERYEFELIYKYDRDYSVYVFLVSTAPYENITEIWVDKYTGKIIPPTALG